MSEKYTVAIGGKPKAIVNIMRALGCSYSKAKQVRRGTYPHELGILETRVLAKLFDCKESDLSVVPSGNGTTSKTAS